MDRDTKAAESTSENAARPRRPYQAPRLRCLGSVRDLTLGSPTADPFSDGMGGKQKTFPM